MFDTTNFWRDMILCILILVVIYGLAKIFVFKRLKNKERASDILINIFLAIGVIFLFYRIYTVIPEMINPAKFFTQNIINNLLYVCVLSLATTGIVLIFKTSTTTNFAQGMIATAGAFAGARVILYLGAKFLELENTPLVLLGMVGGAISAFVIGVLIDVIIIRNSKLPTPVGKQMITMGLVLIFTGVLPLIFKLDLSVPRLSYGDNIMFTLFGLDLYITAFALYALVISIGLLIILFSALRFTKWGLGVRATASNEVVASMMGVNTKIITAMSWGIAGLLGGVAAMILAPTYSTIEVSLMISTQVNGFMAAILGSFGSFAGPLVASSIIPTLTGLMTFIVPGWENAVVYAIILVIVLVKPLGLFGKQVAKKV